MVQNEDAWKKHMQKTSVPVPPQLELVACGSKSYMIIIFLNAHTDTTISFSKAFSLHGSSSHCFKEKCLKSVNSCSSAGWNYRLHPTLPSFHLNVRHRLDDEPWTKQQEESSWAEMWSSPHAFVSWLLLHGLIHLMYHNGHWVVALDIIYYNTDAREKWALWKTFL